MSVQLRRLRTVEEDLGILEQRIQEKLKPYAAQFTLLQEIPGIDETPAAAIIAELGVDMGVFESHLTSGKQSKDQRFVRPPLVLLRQSAYSEATVQFYTVNSV